MRTRLHDDELVWRKKFGDKLKRLIHIKGITQGQFADELGINDVMLSRYITGACTPKPYRIKQMSILLDCDVNCLYEVDD